MMQLVAKLLFVMSTAVALAPGSPFEPGPGDGNFVVGPPYTIDPDLTPQGKPRGNYFNFTMRLSDSKIFTGADPTFTDAGCHGPTPGECCHKTQDGPACAARTDRIIAVYVPSTYVDGSAAPIMVMQDGAGPGVGRIDLVSYALDNLVGARQPGRRRLPPFVAISVQNGGCDAIKSERGLEYDTMSDRYARFLELEVLPAVQAHPALRAKYPSFALTTDPDNRATFGCSSGAAAALTAAWLRPDLFRRVVAYSGTFVDQQDHDDKTGARTAYPFGAWEYHSASQLIVTTTPRKPLRVFHHCSEHDLGYYTEPASVEATGNPDVNNTAGDLTANWTDGHHNWRVAGNRTASALAAAGYSYRHVFAQAVGHCDPDAIKHTLADTLVWLWQDLA